MRTLAIGDIHGCRVALETLVEAVGVTSEDTLVTLGDYVDRGKQTKEAIEFLLELRNRCELFTLRGNHEIMMERARCSRGEASQWLSVGGHAVLDSYRATNLDGIPKEHWDFLAACLPYYENATHFFVHANADPDLDLADQPDDMRYWQHFDDPLPHKSGKTMVCGHTAQHSGLPLNLGHAVCIDTFAHGSGGWLTCLDTATGSYWQANQKGETRVGSLGTGK